MKFSNQPFARSRSGFTMIEIAICLAIIGIALVAIVGVLPIGANAQKENREATVINQDATVFIEAIRNGARGLNDLTNYVYAITNFWTKFDSNGKFLAGNNGNNGINNSYSYSSSYIAPAYYWSSSFPIRNGTNIIGLLSTPEFTDNAGNPTNNLFNGGYSNHIVAYVHSLSGPAVEKPPQDNDILRSDSFSYRLFCVNAPVAADTNSASLTSPYGQQLAANLHELRLTFLWPQQANGNLGSGRQTFRALVAGQIQMLTNYVTGNILYFYQPQSFAVSP